MKDAEKSCVLCQIISGKLPSKKVYEDENILAVLDFDGANPGHCFVMPKRHYTIMEQLPDEELGQLFVAANKVSATLFEVMNIQGTNIFVSNGTGAGQVIAHFFINVIPRMENDGINLQWEPQKINEDEMASAEARIREAVTLGAVNEEGAKQQAARKEREVLSDEENYIVKRMRRLP